MANNKANQQRTLLSVAPTVVKDSFLTPEQVRLLDENVMEQYLKKRPGAFGKDITYVQKDYLEGRLNKIFGLDNWSRETTVCEIIKERETYFHDKKANTDKPGYAVTAKATVKVTILFHRDTETRTKIFEGTGVCTGATTEQGTTSYGDAIELALKGAETDAFKRAVTGISQTFGQQIEARFEAEAPDRNADLTEIRAPAPARQNRLEPTAAAAPAAQAPQTQNTSPVETNNVTSLPQAATPTTARRNIDVDKMDITELCAYLSTGLNQELRSELIIFKTSAPEANPDGQLSAEQWGNFYKGLIESMKTSPDRKNIVSVMLKIATIRSTVEGLQSTEYDHWYNRFVGKNLTQKITEAELQSLAVQRLLALLPISRKQDSGVAA